MITFLKTETNDQTHALNSVPFASNTNNPEMSNNSLQI